MKKIVEKYLKQFGKYQKILESDENLKILDLTKSDRKDYFCLHNTQINNFAKESPETLACTLIFVLVTIRTDWAQVYSSYPKIIAILTKHSDIKKIFSEESFSEAFYKSIIFGFKIPAINYIWDNRRTIYNKVTSILDIEDDVDRDFLLYNYIIKNLSGFSTPKAGFAVQLISGSYGCIDSINSKIYSSFLTGEYNLDKGSMDKRISEYINFLDALKKSTFNIKSANLWNNWCDIVATRIYYTIPKKMDQLIVKLHEDLTPLINTYRLTDIIKSYKEKFPEVDGETISRQHTELISRETFKESVNNKKLKEQENFIKEEYPSDFDWEYFSGLDNLKDIVKYATSKLGKPKKGSSRMTFLVDDDKVLKVAYNQVGQSQNRTETDYVMQQYSIVTKVIRSDDENYYWVESERVKPIRSISHFKKVLNGYTLYDLRFYFDKWGYYKGADESYKKMFEIFNENEFVQELIDLVRSFDLLSGDIFKMSSWGMVKRDNQEQLVLFDYGLTQGDFHNFYKNNKIKKEFR